MTAFAQDKTYALKLDAADPLAAVAGLFYKPEGIYLDGNSLGLMSHGAESTLQRAAEDWKTLGIGGWMEGHPPWFPLAEQIGRLAAPLVGAKSQELVAAGTTTGNIHNLVAAFFKPQRRRRKILADALNFPSDLFALRSILALHGLDPERDLILAGSDDGHTLDESTIESLLNDEIALALLPTVLYRSGQLLDISRLTAACHAHGVIVGWDASHSVGAVPHEFHDWKVDFAMFCGYKYLNGGPGSSAFLFVHEDHHAVQPALAGWFGLNKSKQFAMQLDFEPATGAGRFQVATPQVLSLAPLLGSLAISAEVGIVAIRQKSLALNRYLMQLIEALLPIESYGFRIVNPEEDHRRGGHVALEHRDALAISLALRQRRVIPDFRPSCILRLAPVALYNSFAEVYETVMILRDIIDQDSHRAFIKTQVDVP